MLRACGACVLLVACAQPLLGQTPQPFPRRGATEAQPAAPEPPPSAPPQPSALQAPGQAGAPTAESLGFPIYPGAVFLASYDAGRGQRYHLFGSTTAYAELVAYYREQLRERGDQVYSQPATHMFQMGRFRDETMAFPPGVTIKDWTQGSQGYPNPVPGGTPERFPSVIMIVPAPPAEAR